MNHLEDSLQMNVVTWFAYQYPAYSEDLIHIANQRKCTVQQAMRLQRMGVRKGVSDLFLSIPRGEYHGLWMELKSPKRKPTKEQVKFAARKRGQGYATAWTDNLEDAMEILAEYMRY